MSGAPAEGGHGAPLPSAWEFPLARFLERYGYDIAYTTDVDSTSIRRCARPEGSCSTAGHDEYWTKEMRDAFEAARDSGVNIAFMGANTAYWQARIEDSGHTLVEYRNADQRSGDRHGARTRSCSATSSRPECKMMGVQWGEIGNADYTA